MTSVFVDTKDQVRQMLDSINNINGVCSLSSRPLVFLDLEGINLSRHGSIAIMQLLVPPMETVYLIDVHVLKVDAFSTKASNETTLRSILESSEWPKVFFDVRNDSDALFSHFGVSLSAVIDLQLLEFATRPRVARFVNGLGRCIENDLPMSYTERREWLQVKDKGREYFAPEMGGKYEVFLERPLPEALAKYCSQDIVVMPRLLRVYGARVRISERLAYSIQLETVKRIELSHGPNYNGKGRHMAVGPRLTLESVSVLPFPINLVCSNQLDKMCGVAAASV